MIAIRIPTPLRPYTSNRDEVRVEAATVGEAVAALDRAHPGMKERLLNEKGALRPYINIFRNDEDVRFEGGLDATLVSGDRLAIVPAIAGG